MVLLDQPAGPTAPHAITFNGALQNLHTSSGALTATIDNPTLTSRNVYSSHTPSVLNGHRARKQPQSADTAAGSTACPSTTPEHISPAARLATLQQTPFPMIMARLKVLLDRLHTHDQTTIKAAHASAVAALTTRSSHQCHDSTIGRLDSVALARQLPKPAKNICSACMPLFDSNPLSGGRSARLSSTANRGRSTHQKSLSVPSIGGIAESIEKHSLQAIIEEAQAVLGYVSEFLDRLPVEACLSLATVVSMQSYKKDQLIYDIGEQAESFYIIMSGCVELWSHPPGELRPKSIVSVLTKGQTFGDQAIINGEKHSTAASSNCNTSLLTLSKDDFLAVFGTYFHDVAASWQQFLLSSVVPFAACKPAEVQRLCSAMMSSRPSAGKVWTLQQDQVFFIKEGRCEVQLIDLEAQKAAEAAIAGSSASSVLCSSPVEAKPVAVEAAASAQNEDERGLSVATAAAAGRADGSTGSGLSLGDAHTVSDTGVLASVRVLDGRAVGTLGIEKELRRHRQARVPRKVVAELGPGCWFGGGDAVYGPGAVQSALRIVATDNNCELMHARLDAIIQSGGKALLQRLRDDAAFRFTYLLGRMGVLPVATAVGHPLSQLLVASAGGIPLAVPTGPEYALSASVLVSPKGMPGRMLRAAASVFAASTAAAAADDSSAGNSSIGARYLAKTGDISTPPPAAAAAGGVAALQRTASTAGQTAQQHLSIPEVAAAVAAAGLLRKSVKAKQQKHLHVAGSGMYSPRTMAALQHLQHLQASDKQACSSRSSITQGMLGRQPKPVSTTAEAANVPAASSSGSTVGGGDGGGSRRSGDGSRPSSAGASAVGISCKSIGAGGVLFSAAQPSSGGRQSANVGSQISGSRSNNAFSAYASRTGGSINMVSGGVSGAASTGSGKFSARKQNNYEMTAAERYWCQQSHNSSSTAAALTPLLSSLFPDGLQPLAHEIDGLLEHAAAEGQQVPHLAAGPGAIRYGQHLQQQSCSWPASAQAKLPNKNTADQHAAACSSIDSISKASRLQCSSRPGSAYISISSSYKPQQVDLPGHSVTSAPGQQDLQQKQHVSPVRLGQAAPGAAVVAVDDSAQVLRHKPYSNLLAATVMWQQTSDASSRPALRQCLTSAEVAQMKR